MSRGRDRGARRLAMALVAMLLSGCATSSPSQAAGGSPSSTPTSSPTVTASPTPSATPTPTSASTPVPSAAASCADRTLASLTEAQRIGQLFVIGLIKDRLDATERAAIAESHFGSVTFTTQTSVGVRAVRAITDSVQALATREATGGVPFFIAANQEGGKIQGLSGPGFEVVPSALDQGAMVRGAARGREDATGAVRVHDVRVPRRGQGLELRPLGGGVGQRIPAWPDPLHVQ